LIASAAGMPRTSPIAGFAALHLLFYALWHRRHTERRLSEGDVFEALSAL
jgi:hypothetical protein